VGVGKVNSNALVCQQHDQQSHWSDSNRRACLL